MFGFHTSRPDDCTALIHWFLTLSQCRRDEHVFGDTHIETEKLPAVASELMRFQHFVGSADNYIQSHHIRPMSLASGYRRLIGPSLQLEIRLHS
jgi:hypothetical protein